jgi:hypothetical protein
VILPLLMGSMPAPAPMLCIDCTVYFWMGFTVAMIVAILLTLAAHHYFKD